ncbi:butyryl-CoA dehydrogenase [Nakamurella panacisegetis]|uniref:Butyryl-CoA dehydrogenase n=1 Tax=Nakamurella panacisegetis TaxID=1090615 RepID=A0A1H0SUH1_9ACTN|nr:acyl-CoA dehydrogenase [Nakamurella panacisegetis]SDP44916.1 butyryl-CoA dehydrogenase [Nakamurella panacisegetis]
MPRSLILSRRDLEFLLYEWLDVAALTRHERFAPHSRETFDAVLDLSESIATEEFAPLNRAADQHEPEIGPDGAVVLLPEIEKALGAYEAAGLRAATFDHRFGGQQLPITVHQAASCYFQAASCGLFAYAFLSIGNANLIVAHGSPEQIARYAQPVIDGRFYGTMCLSEPHAGSSLSDITTRAVRQEDGTYRLFGTKMWISAGDHELGENIVHLVLARVEGAPAGVKGISLFIVPKYLLEADGDPGERNDVALVGLNHKMGFRGTTNALLNFGEGLARPGDRPGAIGHLVGQENNGLRYMFHMMNEARISVGAGAVALGYTGYLHSLEYARTRTQGRPVNDKDPSSAPVPIIDHPDVRRMLLAQKSYAEGGLALVLYCAHVVDTEQVTTDAREKQRLHTLLEVLTPIAKSWPSQWCVAANDLAIQVHGGAGYTRDYPVEQFYRDNRLNSIHEGTHGIQALDLLGRKVTMDHGAGLAVLVDTMRATITRASPALRGQADTLAAAVDRLVAVTADLWRDRDSAAALANATVYLEAAGHVVLAWIWLEQLLVADGRSGAFYDGKRAAGQYFYRFELPTVNWRFDLLAGRDRTTLDLDPAVL